MKFGQTLLETVLKGWRYVDYEKLKSAIKSRTQQTNRNDDKSWSSTFLKSLLVEINDVNSFFLGMEAMLKDQTAFLSENPAGPKVQRKLGQMMTDLCKFVVVNYLAILKIVKKHDKWCTVQLSTTVKRTLFATDFFISLRNSELFVTMNQLLKKLKQCPEANAETNCCPICMETISGASAHLPCGHLFCWSCLAEATWQQHEHCPLCRQEQSLEPVNLEISTIIGSLCQHYFPDHVESKIYGSKTSPSLCPPITADKVACQTTSKKTQSEIRKRPFGSIRCSKCNKFGLESECCGKRYHVVVRVRRVPAAHRAALVKEAFLSFKAADAARRAVELRFPKQRGKRSRHNQPISTASNVKEDITLDNSRYFSGAAFEKFDDGWNQLTGSISQNILFDNTPCSLTRSPSQPCKKKCRVSLFPWKARDSVLKAVDSNAQQTMIEDPSPSLEEWDMTGTTAFSDTATTTKETSEADPKFPPADSNFKDAALEVLVHKLYSRLVITEARAFAANQQRRFAEQQFSELEKRLQNVERQLLRSQTCIDLPLIQEADLESSPSMKEAPMQRNRSWSDVLADIDY